MMVGSPENLAGAGAFIVSSRGTVLTVEELTTSARTGKERGMRTHPMESLEPGETIGNCLERIFSEEVRLSPDQEIVDVGPLCDVQITPDIRVRMFLFQSPEEWPVQIGTAKTEVADCRWVPIEDVLYADIGSNRFRVGVRETAKGFNLYTVQNNDFQPVYFPFSIDYSAVAARIGGQTSRNEGWSQPAVPSRFVPGPAF